MQVILELPKGRKNIEFKVEKQFSKKLSNAERRVLLLLQKGYSNDKIANELGIKACSVKFQLTSLYKKYDVKSRAELLTKIVKEENDHLKLFLKELTLIYTRPEVIASPLEWKLVKRAKELLEQMEI